MLTLEALNEAILKDKRDVIADAVANHENDLKQHINSLDAKGKTVLLNAVLHQKKFETAALLIAAGADTNSKNKKKYSLLTWAAHKKDLETIKFLISQKVDINGMDANGRTVLDVAIVDENPDLIPEFIKLGANPFWIDRNGDTAIAYARQFDYRKAVHLLEKGQEEYRKSIQNNSKSQKQLDIFLKLQDRAKTVKMLGHVMGVNTTIDIALPGGNPYPIKSEGSYNYESATYLRHYLQKYIERLRTQPQKTKRTSLMTTQFQTQHHARTIRHFEVIHEGFAALEEYLSCKVPRQRGLEKLLSRYNTDKKMLVLGSGFKEIGWKEGHATCIYIYNGKLGYINRGPGSPAGGGNRLYELKKDKDGSPVPITLEWLNRFMQLGPLKDQESIERVLSEIIDISKPIKTFKTKKQLHGNCTMASKKSAMENMLYTLGMEETKAKSEGEAEAEGVEDRKIEEEEPFRSEKEYKASTAGIRDIFTEELSQKIAEAVKNGTENDIQFYRTICVSMLAEHSGAASKRETRLPGKHNIELDRAFLVLQAFDSDSVKKIYQALDAKNTSIFLNAVMNQHHELIKLLLRSDVFTARDIVKELCFLEDSPQTDEKIINLYHQAVRKGINADQLFAESIKAGDFRGANCLIPPVSPTPQNLLGLFTAYHKRYEDTLVHTSNNSTLSICHGFLEKVLPYIKRFSDSERQSFFETILDKDIPIGTMAAFTNHEAMFHLYLQSISSGNSRDAILKTIGTMIRDARPEDMKSLLEFMARQKIEMQEVGKIILQNKNIEALNVFLESEAINEPASIRRVIQMLTKSKKVIQSDTSDTEGDTALMIALKKGYFNIAKFLLENKEHPFNPHLANSEEGYSAVSIAGSLVDPAGIKLFLDHDVDITEVDETGHSALSNAIASSNFAVLYTILAAKPELLGAILTEDRRLGAGGSGDRGDRGDNSGRSDSSDRSDSITSIISKAAESEEPEAKRLSELFHQLGVGVEKPRSRDGTRLV